MVEYHRFWQLLYIDIQIYIYSGGATCHIVVGRNMRKS